MSRRSPRVRCATLGIIVPGDNRLGNDLDESSMPLAGELYTSLIMNRFLRPVSLFVVLGLVLLAGAYWYYLGGASQRGPKPLAVAPGEHEIVWLESASNTTGWERFLMGVQEATPNAEIDPKTTFPSETTATPEFRIRCGPVKLVFRWYKLTSTWKNSDWIDALMQRSPPPLVILGGNFSYQARDQATELRRAVASLPDEDRWPLLFLTTATADRVEKKAEDRPVPDYR